MSLEEFRHIERLINEEKEVFFDDLSEDDEEKIRLSVLLYDAGRLSFHHKGLRRHGLQDSNQKIFDNIDLEKQSKYLKVIFRHLRYIARKNTNLRRSYKNREFFKGEDKISSTVEPEKIRNAITKCGDIVYSELESSPERWIGSSDSFSVYKDEVKLKDVKKALTQKECKSPKYGLEEEINELFEKIEGYLGLHPKIEEEAYAYPVQYAGQYQGFIYIIIPKDLWEYPASKAYNYLDKISRRLAPKIFQAKLYNFEKRILEGDHEGQISSGVTSEGRTFFDHVERVLNVVGGVMRISHGSGSTHFLKRVGHDDGVAPFKLQTCSVDADSLNFEGVFEDYSKVDPIQFEDVAFDNSDSIDVSIREKIHPLESEMMEELITPNSKILFSYKFDENYLADFCLYLYDKKEELIQESHQINATLSRMIATVERAENLRRTTRKAEEKARRNTVSTVMLRNFAHNIGSHVAANTTNDKVKERIRNLYHQ